MNSPYLVHYARRNRKSHRLEDWLETIMVCYCSLVVGWCGGAWLLERIFG